MRPLDQLTVSLLCPMGAAARCTPAGSFRCGLAVPHAPGVGWPYVLDPDVGDDWHIVRDLGLMPPKGRALCDQLPPSLDGWPAVTASRPAWRCTRPAAPGAACLPSSPRPSRGRASPRAVGWAATQPGRVAAM